MPDEEKDNAQEGGAEAAGGGSSSGSKAGMLIVIIVGFLVMILTPLVSYFVVKATAPAPIVDTEEVVEDTEVVLDLDAVMINIAKTQGTRVLRLKPHLVLSEPRLAEKLGEMQSMLSDRIMTAASRRSIDELEGPQGRESLKRDIMSEINAIIKEKLSGAVVDVYFSEFLVQ